MNLVDYCSKLIFVKFVEKYFSDMNHQLSINYPDTLPDALQQTVVQFEADAKMAMAVKFFEMNKLSSGMAAQLAGVDRVYFLLNLHKYGVNMIDLENDELESDLKNA